VSAGHLILNIKGLGPVDVVKQFSQSMRGQLDLTEEARNLEVFLNNFASEPYINFPSPIGGLISQVA
jgi:predicted unusual protein kinase regulating ubiquinone biosynthesis (AarF/ABC1/UbiB family)